MTSIPPPVPKRLLRWFLRLLAIALLGLLGLVALIYFRQHSMLYHPRPYDTSYEQTLPDDGVELQFNTLAGKQVAFYLPHGTGTRLPKHIWVAFCGNGALALEWVWLLEKDRNRDDAFLLIDYPGYGKSEGYATIGSTRAAADKALDTLASHLAVTKDEIETRLNLIGHSWGTAVALDFAIPRVVIFHGTNDEIIPMRMGRELAETFPAIVSFHPIKGGDHVSILGQAEGEILAIMHE